MKGKSSQATSEEGLDVELRNPRKKGMDIIETVQVQRYEANHSQIYLLRVLIRGWVIIMFGPKDPRTFDRGRTPDFVD